MNPDRWQQVSQLYHAAVAQDARERGRFLAQFEVHVRPFPDVNSGHWQVSTGGGSMSLTSGARLGPYRSFPLCEGQRYDS